jgi:hypothetical protein
MSLPPTSVGAAMRGRECNSRDQLCSGTSPTGVRWVLTTKPHTGTGTTVKFFQEQAVALNVGNETKCAHSHAFCRMNATTLAFVANPYRMVLSSAAYMGAISGSRHVYRDRTEVDEVRHFRAWLLGSNATQLGLGQCQTTNQLPGWGRCKQTPGHGGGWYWVPESQAAWLRAFSPTSLIIGRTVNLQRDMRAVLAQLGYRSESLVGEAMRFESIHCSSSCSRPQGGGMHYEKASNYSAQSSSRYDAMRTIQWYDNATAQVVLHLMGEDFEAFGFSRDPQAMWDDVSPFAMPFSLNKLHS